MFSKMKNFAFITLATIVLFACGKEDEPLEPISFDSKVSASVTEANIAVTFTDNSTGVTSRTWTFPGGTPATSNDAVVNVVFKNEGPVTCKLDVVFRDGTTDTKSFVIKVGKELYARSIFGFEDNAAATTAWKRWVSNGSEAVTFSVDNTQGANGTSKCAKIVINTPDIESQIFTKENDLPFNAILESNKSYTFSFWIKSPTLTSITAVEVTNLSTSQAWHNFAWYSPVQEITSEWSQKSITFKTGDISKIYSEGRANNAYVQFKFLEKTAGTIFVDELSIKENK
jgi:chitodextrinase